MWLFYFVLPLAIVMIVGGLLAGGIYTIVFLPVAIIIAFIVIAFTMYGKSSQRRTLPSDRPQMAPSGTTEHANVAPRPDTPDELVDARRHAQ